MATIIPAGSTLRTLLQTYSLPLLLLLLLAYFTTRTLISSLSDIPGPRLAAYTKLWRLYDVWQGHAHLTAMTLHKKYGKLVRIAPNVVSVGDADEVSKIYNSRETFTKTAFYPIQSISWQKKPAMNTFSTRSVAEHREQRKKIANAYSVEQLLKMEGAIDDCGRQFVQKLHGFADQGNSVDLGAWSQYYAFDVIGELTFGCKLGFLEKGGDVDDMMGALESMLVYASHCGQVPEMHWWLLGNPLLNAVMPAMETWNQVVVFTLKAINRRTTMSRDGELELNESHVSHDMLSKWAAIKASDPIKMNTRDIVVALSANVFAGSDTTSIALRAVLYFLMKNPETMGKLQHEIDDADKAGKISNPVKDEEARNKLPYLNAVLREAMRMHPSVGLLLERHVPDGGAVICGKFIPGGVIVGINPWVLHYNPEVFPNPESFEPERWLEADKERLANMDKHFFEFGAGSRSCIASNIAMIAMRKIVPELVREFDMSMGSGKEWQVKNVWFTQQQMPPVFLKRRSLAYE